MVESPASVADWVTRARTATDPVQRLGCLDAAATAATERWEVGLVLRAVEELCPDDRQRLAAATAAVLRAAATVPGWAGEYLAVARIRARYLDDAPGARALLDRMAAALAGEPGMVGPWVELGEAYATTLGDRDTARRCMGTAAEQARAQPYWGNLCFVATRTVVPLDRAEALALVAQAEESATIPSSVDGVVKAWRALGEESVADALLARAASRVRSARDALAFALQYHSHGDAAGTDRELARARQLARTAEDWIDVAESAHGLRRPDSDVRTALERASALAGTDIDRGGVANGYRRWLGDTGAADRIGPPGLPPGAFQVPRRTLAGWPSSPSALFDWLRPRLTDEALTDIAGSDYGGRADEHLAALREIRDTGRFPWRWDWCPLEVLGLTYATADDPLQRAWSTTLLWLGPDSISQDPASLGARLVESCLALGDPAPYLAGQLLAWLAETDQVEYFDGDDEDDGCPPLILLALLILGTAADPTDPRIGPLAAATLAQYGRWYPAGDAERPSATAGWDELVERFLVPARTAHPELDGLLSALGR